MNIDVLGQDPELSVCIVCAALEAKSTDLETYSLCLGFITKPNINDIKPIVNEIPSHKNGLLAMFGFCGGGGGGGVVSRFCCVSVIISDLFLVKIKFLSVYAKSIN